MSSLANIKLLIMRTEASLQNTTILLEQLKIDVTDYEKHRGKLSDEVSKLV